jgi:hypothetical protein
MSRGSALAAIVSVADKHLDLPDDKLVILLDTAWTRAGLGGVPTRGTRREYWRAVRNEIVQTAAAQSESVSVMTGMVATDVLRWAAERGIPTEEYTYPVGLLVAWVTIAMLKKSSKDKPQK